MGMDYYSEQAWSKYGDELAERSKRLEELSKPAKDLKEAKEQLEEIKNTTLNFAGLDDKEAWKFAWWDKIMEVEKLKKEEEPTKISGVTRAKGEKKMDNKWWYFTVEYSSPVRGGVHMEGRVYAKNARNAYDKVIKEMYELEDFGENNVDLFEVWSCDKDENDEVIITETRFYNEEG